MKLLLISLLIAMVVIFLALTGILLWKDWSYYESEPYRRKPDSPADVLVLYYSRSGKTEAMAREIARRLQADLLKITAESYSEPLTGMVNANRDAWNRNPADIEPQTVDINQYKLIFLGSPIWWYRPAPPLWTFVEKNNFRDKAVVLFNTFNSRFKPEEIKLFQKLVEKKGGQFLDHIYVRRGRIYHQLSGRELIRETQKLLDAREEQWQGIIQRRKF